MAQDTSTSNKEITVSSLKSSLQQQNIPADKLQGNDNFLTITPPGISIGEVRSFLKGTLAEFGDFGQELSDMIPDSLPIDGIALRSLKFVPKAPDGTPYLLQLTISWVDAKWDMIPGVIALEAPQICLQVEGGRVSGSVSGVVEIEGIPLLMELDLPGELISVQLAKADGEQESAADLLQNFKVGPDKSQGAKRKGVNLGALTLNDLKLLASIKGRRALFHLALGNIQIGPGDMALQMTLDYLGGTSSQITGSVYGEYDVKKKDDPNTNLFSISLLAEYDGPEQGWLFEGSGSAACSIKDLILAFDSDATGIPGFLSELTIKFLNLSYNTSTGSFSFSCDVDIKDLFGAEAELDMIVSIKLQKVGTSYEKTFSGQLVFNLEDHYQLEFDILFNQAPTGTADGETQFIAAYKNEGGGKINIGQLTRKIDPSFYVPLTIDLKDAFFIYDKKSKAKPADFLFGLDIGSGINLSKLPLIGKILPADQTLKIGIQPLIASGPQAPYFSAEELSTLANLVPGGGIDLPSKPIDAQVGLGINLNLGSKSFHFDLPIKLGPKAQPQNVPKGQTPPESKEDAGSAIEEKPKEGNESPEKQMETSPGAVATSPPAPSSDGSNIQWLNIQKSFGPVHFNRIGLQYADKKVWAFLDAGLSLAGLTLTMDGLGVGTPITKLDPKFKLLGIGIDYQQGPVEIGGSFLHYKVKPKGGDPYDEYDGTAVIKAEIINISAIGAYARVDGHDSLFIYAVLNYPIGGPSFFFLTGIAAGFGYNRAVRIPDITGVAQFPLVNEAVGGEGSPPPTGLAERRSYLSNEIAKLRDYIYPKPGEYFLTAGIRFSSFEMIDSFAMVVVSFGQHFELDILGLSTLIIPTPEEGQSVSPLAEMQLALKATLNPAEGFLGVQAQLTNNSFILSRDCRLTGGFAFFVWFGGPHEGEFVITLGGYHPRFQKPAFYPSVPRLGFNWVLTSFLYLKGEIYFALCAHALMAGGSLQAVFHLGGIKAWFIIGADFIISWKPYFFDAHIYLDMGVSVTFWLFGTHTITVHIGADLQVWGPDFSGKATIHLWIISFTISFGDASPKPQPISWSNFKSSFLPQADKICSIAVANGLIRKLKNEDHEVQVINPKDFSLRINTVIPFMKAIVENQGEGKSYDLAVAQLDESAFQNKIRINTFQWNGTGFVQAESAEKVTTGKVGIAPMALKSNEIQSNFYVTLTKRDIANGQYVYLGEDFAFTPLLKKMPMAMWGETLTPSVNSPKYVENALTGFEISPAQPSKPGVTHPVPKSELQYTTTHIGKAYSFETLKAFNASNIRGSGKAYISGHIATNDSMKKRRGLIEALGFDYQTLGVELNPSIADDFVKDPQVGDFA